MLLRNPLVSRAILEKPLKNEGARYEKKGKLFERSEFLPFRSSRGSDRLFQAQHLIFLAYLFPSREKGRIIRIEKLFIKKEEKYF